MAYGESNDRWRHVTLKGQGNSRRNQSHMDEADMLKFINDYEYTHSWYLCIDLSDLLGLVFDNWMLSTSAENNVKFFMPSNKAGHVCPSTKTVFLMWMKFGM